MNVITAIKPFKVKDVPAKVGDIVELQVENVWNSQNLVRLKFGDVKIEVDSRELFKAISNATNNEVL